MTDLRITQLESGLTVATEHVPGALSVATGVWVGVGSRDEPAELSGVSHFLEHLLFKGTPTRSSQDISRSVDRVGGDFNAFTAKEYTAYYCRLPARHAVFGVDLLGDVLIRPALREADVDSERLVILEELAMDDDSPDDVAHRMFAAQLFADHPLGRETAGDRDTVQAITAADVRQFFESHYHAGSMVSLLPGHRSRRGAAAGVERVRRCTTERAHSGSDAPTAVGGSDSIDDDTEQIHIVMGGRALARGDEDREALDVVNHVFGGGLSSRLFEEIRERRGLAYSVYSGVVRLHRQWRVPDVRRNATRRTARGDRPDALRARPIGQRRHHRRRARCCCRLPHRRIRARPGRHRRTHGPQRRPADHHRLDPPHRRAGCPLGRRRPDAP